MAIKESTKRKKNKSEAVEEEEAPVMSPKERMAKGELLVKALIEVLGAPKEYVEKTLDGVLDKVNEEKYLEVTFEESFEATPVKDNEKLLTAFAEVEFWVKSPKDLLSFVFDFTPSSIDVLEPTESMIGAKDLSDLMLDLIARLHFADMRVKEMSAHVKLMDKNSINLVRNFIVFSLQNKELSLEQISKNVGIPADKIENFLGQLVKEKVIEKKGDVYSSMLKLGKK
ncbi:hypothetical protein HN587_05890 [Candidatus Woesearchaeota archaeon]|jgi:hypothetical protein|nr:hypothetical protein [Candidatus Woesearchaeota archaeon]